MKRTILIFISFVFFTSCSLFKKDSKKTNKLLFNFNQKTENIKIVEFEEKKTIELPDNELMKFDYKLINDSIIRFSGFKVNTNKIYTYLININTNKVTTDSFDFKFDLTSPSDISYINNDSIFLFYPPAYRDFYHDSILLLINNKGNIKKIYSFNDVPVLTKNNRKYENNDEAVYVISNLYEPFTFIDDKLFLMFNDKSSYIGDPAYSNAILAGYINTKTDKFTPIKFKYPDIEYGKTFFPRYYKKFTSVLGKPNHILYNFSYTPTIIDYNFKTSKFEKHYVKSSVYDTIYPSLSEKELPNGFGDDCPLYFKLLYDNYRNLYYRIIMPPHISKTHKAILMVIDENFNLVAEGFLPRGINLFTTKDYLILLGNDKKKASKGKGFITFYKLKYRNGTNQELISKIKGEEIAKPILNKPITHYLKKNTNIKEKNNTTTFMYYEMCPKVRAFVLGFYQFNKTKLEKANVNLVLVTENVQSLRKDLKRFNLLPENNSNIFIDSTYTFASYNGNKRNDLPRIVTIRNNKIVTDTIFNNDDGKFHENFQKFLIKSGKEQEALKEK